MFLSMLKVEMVVARYLETALRLMASEVKLVNIEDREARRKRLAPPKTIPTKGETIKVRLIATPVSMKAGLSLSFLLIRGDSWELAAASNMIADQRIPI